MSFSVPHLHALGAQALVVALAALGVPVACGSGAAASSAAKVSVSPPLTAGGPPKLATFASGLVAPWALAFLPDGRMIVTEKAGTMRTVSADGKTIGAALSGVPPVNARGQGGLLDVAIDPDFATNSIIYWAYSEEAAGDPSRRGTAIYRAKLQGNSLIEAA